MDLGLDQLSDDQIMELQDALCVELTKRDPYLRGMAQHTITTAAERLKVQRAMLQEAVTALAGSYVEQIRAETFAEVREGLRKGTVRLLTPAQEARVLVDSTFEAKIKLIDETVVAIQNGIHPPEPAIETIRQRKIPGDEDYAEWSRRREEQELKLREAKQRAALDLMAALQAASGIMPNMTGVPKKTKKAGP